MRGIKFRVWDKEKRTMITNHKLYMDVLDGQIMDIDIDDFVDGIEIMQYTGYKMFNEDVYFDDLVSNNYGTDKEVIRKIVLFEGNMVMERVKGYSGLLKRISLHGHHNLNYKIIGNIYENPETK